MNHLHALARGDFLGKFEVGFLQSKREHSALLGNLKAAFKASSNIIAAVMAVTRDMARNQGVFTFTIDSVVKLENAVPVFAVRAVMNLKVGR
jgi:hypothetical protein